jgi:hypothetical protein
MIAGADAKATRTKIVLVALYNSRVKATNGSVE